MKSKMLMLILCVLVIPLMCFPAFASFTDEWGEYQDDETGWGFVGDEIGIWNTSYDYTQTASGSNYQPITLSIDGERYVVIATSTTLKVYDTTQTLIADEVFAVINSQPIIYDDADDDTIIFAVKGEIMFYQFDGSDLNYVISFNLTSGINETSIKCGVNHENASITDCYVIGDFNTTHSRLMHFTIDAADAEVYYTIARWDFSVFDAIMTDWDAYNSYDLIGNCDPDGDSMYGICVVDEGGVYNGLFSADGIIDDISNNAPPVNSNQMMIYNIDGGTYAELIVIKAASAGGAMGAGQTVFIYDHLGNVDCYAQLGNNNPQFNCGQPTGAILASVNDGGRWVAVHIGQTLSCASGSCTFYLVDDECNIDYSSPAVFPGCTLSTAVADMGGLSDKSEIISGGYIFDPFNNYTLTNMSGVMFNKARLALANLENTGSLDVIAVNSSYLQFFYSGFVNDPPVLNNSLNRGGYFGYMNPACVNTTVTFQAQECGGVADCNYENDASEDTERIVTTCGISGGTLENGTFDLSNPTFDCVYNSTGTYNVRLFLQDDANPTDFTQYNTQYITLLVIDGIPGSTCDIPSSIIDAPSDQGGVGGTGGTAYASDELSSVLDDLFGADTAFKNMIAIGIIIAVASSAAAVGGMAAGAIAAIAVTVLVMILGLLSVWIMVLLIALMLLGIVVSKMIFGAPA